MLLGAVTVLGASMNSHVRCAYGGKMISPSLQTFIVALPASGKGVLSLVRLLVEPIHDEIRLHTAEAMKQYRKEKGAYDSLGKERSQATPPRACPTACSSSRATTPARASCRTSWTPKASA